MRVLNFGSLNNDIVFSVNEIVRPGETINSKLVSRYPGGKGLNQSIALAKAGADVYHAGLIGEDGKWLKDLLSNNGVNCKWIKETSASTGCAFIQVDSSGQNCIVLDSGANGMNDREYCDTVLNMFSEGDILLLQNEINEIDYLISKAHEKKMQVFLNPSPMDEKILECDIEKVDWLIMNETEAEKLLDCPYDDNIIKNFRNELPHSNAVITLGEEGSICIFDGEITKQKAYRVSAVDTTAAGDTFTGYFIAMLDQGEKIGTCLNIASKAASISITRQGASISIPTINEVMLFQT